MKKSPSRPTPESYWVEPGRFLAGEYPGSRLDLEMEERLVSFLDAGIETFIDLTQVGEREPYQPVLFSLAERFPTLTVSHQRFPIPDFNLPSITEMKTILDAIDGSLSHGHPIYLHCWGGVGRTGTVVGCYLVRRGLSGPQALRQLARWWAGVPKHVFFPHSPETGSQVQFVLDWKE